VSYSQLLFQARAYIAYAKKAQGPHGVHSPFVFDLITQVLPRNIDYYCFEGIEQLRRGLFQDDRMLQVEDLGAGSVKGNNPNRSVRSIAKSALKSPLLAQLLFRLVQKQKPRCIVELGTSLGITTSYLANAVFQGKVITFEGASEIAKVAQEVWSDQDIENVEVVIGDFDLVLESRIGSLDQIDVVFVDGNHRKEPTLRYFELLLTKVPDSGIMVFDDIHWSSDMQKAWDVIKNHPRVTISLDFYDFGVVYFNKDFPRQQFVLKVP
jgi:predicted O-methyltransferase YrrM